MNKISTRKRIRISLIFLFLILASEVTTIVYVNYALVDESEQTLNRRLNICVNYINNHFKKLPNNKDINTDKFFSDFLRLYNADYLVVENDKGEISGGINIKIANSCSYSQPDKNSALIIEKALYKTQSPLILSKSEKGKIYIGFDRQDTIASIYDLNNKLIIGGAILFLFSIPLIWIVLLFSFNFMSKILKTIDKFKDGVPVKQLDHSGKQKGLWQLNSKIFSIMEDLETTNARLVKLNTELNTNYKEKLAELNWEMNNRRLAEKSLISSEEKFRILFEQAPIGMISIQDGRRIIKANTAFCETLGYSIEELPLLKLSSIFDNDLIENLSVGNQEINVNYEYSLQRKDGIKINVIIKTVEIKDSTDGRSQLIIQVLDITDIVRIQKELSEALTQAEESDRLKSAFLAQMSHEIRTPLNVILTATPMLAEEIGTKDSDVLSILDSVNSAGKRLQRTIDMILNMSSVQSGNYKPDFEKLNLAEQLKKLLKEFDPICTTKNLKLSFKNNSKNPFVLADKYTLYQIFQNLIGNAVKYTLHGSIELIINEITSEKIEVIVKDTGRGIKEEYLQNIFKPFSQEDVGQKREFEGNGLGLALVKKYVEINNANIEVESVKTVGSVFRVTFDQMNKEETVMSQNNIETAVNN